MKNRARFISICFILILITFNSCKKGGTPPTVETFPVTGVTATTAECGGTVTSEGSSAVTARGVCWAAKLNPTIDDIKSLDGAGPGDFTSSIGGLYPGISYWVRAYATNSAGTGYGEMKSFTPTGQVPTVTTVAATNITATSATLNGLVSSNASITTVTFQYGKSAAYTDSATASQGPLSEDASGPVSADITGLTASTTYHFRVTAVNTLGTSFGADLTFTTKASK